MATSVIRKSPRIPLATCEDMLAKVRWELENLKAGWSDYAAFNFAVTAYHLKVDWLKQAGSSDQVHRLENLPPDAQTVFKLLGQITNATKHWDLNARNQATQTIDEVTDPGIADWEAYFFGETRYLTLKDGARPSFKHLAELATGCLAWVVEGSEPFPTRLTTGLADALKPL